jgi:hypothetical protein
MSFKYSTDPKEWQNSYTEKQAFADSMQKVDFAMIILMLPILFSLLYLAPPLISTLKEGVTQSKLIGVSLGGFLFILPIGLYLAIRGYLLKNAETFLKTFYDLPESINIKELLDLRVNGRSPMPPPLSDWMKFPTIKVKNGQLEPQENWHRIIGGPVKLKIEPGNALYLERGRRFSRVVGQGPAFLELHETIKTVLNVSPRSEIISVIAWTKDGIRVKIDAKGKYFFGFSPETEIEKNELYPYDPDAVRKAVEEIFANGKEGHEWSKFALGKTIGILSEYISNRYLDEIFIASTNGGQLLSTSTMNDLLINIKARLKKIGISLSHLIITDVELPMQIINQRIKLWETGHKTYQTVTESEVKAYQLRSQKKALAEMVHDLVFTLTNEMERMDSTDLTDKLLSSIYEVINQGMKDPRTYYASSKKTPDGLTPPDLDINISEGEE